jgi:hypothetical protein
MEVFENFLAEIGAEDATNLFAQIKSELPEELVMAGIADPATYTALSQIAAEHHLSSYMEDATMLAQTFAEASDEDMEMMLSQLDADALDKLSTIIDDVNMF